MKMFFSLFLLASITFIGLCPSIMAYTDIPSCHNMEMKSEAIQCDHINFFGDVRNSNAPEIQFDENILVNSLNIFSHIEKKENILKKITPNISLTPPPFEWGKQKKTIVIRI